MNQKDRGARKQAPDRLVRRRDYIRKSDKRKSPRQSKKMVKEVLLPAGLGIASGLALICAYIYDPGYRVPEHEEPMIQAQGGEYWYPADQYTGYLQEKAKYDELQREKSEIFWRAIQKHKEWKP